MKYRDENTTISYDGENIKYIIVKDGEIIEEYNNNSDMYNKSLDKIHKIITSEYDKIILEN